MRLTIPVSSMILLLCCSPAFAEFYKWTDKNGVMHMSTTPPDKESSASSPEQVLEDGDIPEAAGAPGAPRADVTTPYGTIREKKDYLYSRIEYSKGDCKTKPLPP